MADLDASIRRVHELRERVVEDGDLEASAKSSIILRPTEVGAWLTSPAHPHGGSLEV